MTPIPLSVLCMRATHYIRSGDDDYGNPAYGAGVTISGIYVEPVRAVNLGSYGDSKRGELNLYFDAVNSYPRGRVFAELDKVVFGGVSYLVRRSQPYYDPLSGELHHQEVELVGN